ncbi:MAG: leucine-rich repeat protein [Lachnospiraceae bacterium]|nr:leucine-rich repeat protein [Lachnospiraceae bacterium]
MTSIAVNACSACNALTSITIPASVTSITDAAFSDCPALASITVASDNPKYCSVDGVLFNKDKSELILYPAAKQGTSYEIPSGVRTIVSGAFCNCVFSSVTIPDTVTAIEDFAFEACENLTSVEVPDSVTELGTCVFYDCISLTSAVIGDGVSEIPYGLFEYCESLTTVTIPDCSEIGERALYKCSSLSMVYYCGSKTRWASMETGSGNDMFTAAKIYYGIGGCTITLSATSYTYDGKAKKPTVTVTDGTTTLTKGTDYTSVTYSNNTDPGTASVTITGKGDYKGSTATVYFTINKMSQTVIASASASKVTAGQTVTITASGLGTITYSSSDTSIAKVSSKGVVTGKKPGTVKITVTASGNDYYASASVTIKIKVKLASGTISSLTNKSSGIVVKWAKITGADGYYVYRRTSSGSYSLIATISGASTVRYVDTAVKSKNGTTYVYKVIAYSGTTTNSCTAKKTVRLTTPTISGLTSSESGSMTIKWKKSSKATGYQIQYSTSSSFASAKTKTVWVKSASQVSQTITGLTEGKTYYIRIRTYYKNSSGTKYYSAWSDTQKIVVTE